MEIITPTKAPIQKSINNKHDLIILHLYDEIEKKIPMLGLIQLEENESKYKKWINLQKRKLGLLYLIVS